MEHYNSSFVSLVIITHDPTARYVKKTLTTLLTQTYRNFEVILVDSGQTQKSSKIVKTLLKQQDITFRIVRVPPVQHNSFNYAHAYNEGITQARGDIIIRLSGDAIPVGRSWIAQCVRQLQQHNTGIVSGRDVTISRLVLDRYLFSGLYTGLKNSILQPRRKKIMRFFPLINGPCMIFWRSIWQKHAFNTEWVWGEEFEFATWALSKGYYIVFDPDIKTLHAHMLGPSQAFKRIYTDLVFYYMALRLLLGHALSNTKSLLKEQIDLIR